MAVNWRAGTENLNAPCLESAPIHFALKSQRKIYENRHFAETELRRQAKKFVIRIYSLEVAHEHLHFLALLPSRDHYIKFIRALCGLLARKLGAKLWALPPFSRVANWGKDFNWLKNYLAINREEAAGRRPYEPREDWYRSFRGKPG
jgi:hypothetical protein